MTDHNVEQGGPLLPEHEDWCCAKGCAGYGHCFGCAGTEADCKCLVFIVRIYVERNVAARLSGLVAEVSEIATIGQTGYAALTADQVQRFREHPLGAGFGDIADVPEGRNAVIAWLSRPPASTPEEGPR